MHLYKAVLDFKMGLDCCCKICQHLNVVYVYRPCIVHVCNEKFPSFTHKVVAFGLNAQEGQSTHISPET